VQDVLVRLDRTLGAFFSALDQRVGRGNYTVALTADHGVAPLPDRLRLSGIESGRIDPIQLASTIDAALAKVLGPGKYVEYFLRTEVYLRPGVLTRLRQKRSSLAAVKAAIRSVKGIAQVYTRVELEADQFTNDPIGHAAALGYSKERSGDLKLIWSPYWSDKDKGAEHGTGYEYDNHVPILLMGRGIVPGEYRKPASPTDVAPTLASLARIKMPKATGRVLDEALALPTR
jgi:arylsulfatase A-like enzyme